MAKVYVVQSKDENGNVKIEIEQANNILECLMFLKFLENPNEGKHESPRKDIIDYIYSEEVQ